MAEFDQRSQQVTTQVNVAGNAYFGTGPDGSPLSAETPVSLRGRLSRNVPTPSAVFTGREDELARLHDALRPGDPAFSAVPVALQGMAGVGKSQTAAEYAHSHREDYEGVFWVRGETPADFEAQMAGLAAELVPPVAVQSDQSATFQAVLGWFSAHSSWLLIVDNAANLPALRPLLPRFPVGRVLLTSREILPADLGQNVEIRHLDDATGATLLLRRAGTLAPEAPLSTAEASLQTDAQAVSRTLGGLPLALDQAGAYMQQRRLSPAKYRDYYAERRQSLHKQYANPDHASVAVTFALALEQVEQIPDVGSAAAELIRLCAFLAPDAIPDAVFRTNPAVLPAALATLAADEIDFADVCEAASRYVLLRRETDPPALAMHRLAQETVRESLPEAERKTTAEHALNAVRAAFPNPVFANWPACQSLLTHALLCGRYVPDYGIETLDAALLLGRTGTYLRFRARYAEAEPYLRLSLALRKSLQGPRHHQVAVVLNNLALLYTEMGRYKDAVPLQEEAVAIDRETIGEDVPDFATSLDNLATMYYRQDRYADAIRLVEQSLAITKRTLGERDSQVAIRLNNLGNIYTDTGHFADAEKCFAEALAIDRETIGETHPDFATHLLNAGRMYARAGRPDLAHPLLSQAFQASVALYGGQHPDIAHELFWLAQVFAMKGDVPGAIETMQEAHDLFARLYGPDSPDTANAQLALSLMQGAVASGETETA